MLVPYNSKIDKNNQIRSLFEQQNTFMRNTVTIRINNLRNIDQVIQCADRGTATVTDQLMNCKRNNGQLLFLHICQFNRAGVNLLAHKENLHEAVSAVKEYLNFAKNDLPPTSCEKIFIEH